MNETHIAEDFAAAPPKKAGALRRMKKPVTVAGIGAVAIALWMMFSNSGPGGGSDGDGGDNHQITITPADKENETSETNKTSTDSNTGSNATNPDTGNPANLEQAKKEFLSFSEREVLTVVVTENSYAVRQQLDGDAKLDHAITLDEIADLARKTTGNDQNIHVWIIRHYTSTSKATSDLQERLRADVSAGGAGLSPTEIYTQQSFELD